MPFGARIGMPTAEPTLEDLSDVGEHARAYLRANRTNKLLFTEQLLVSILNDPTAGFTLSEVNRWREVEQT